MDQLVAVVMGSFELGGGDEAWDARPLDPDRYDDWIDDALLSGGAMADTVGELFATAESTLSSEHGLAFLERTRSGDRVSVVGMLVEEQAPAWARSILTALREAAEVGASGSVALAVPALQAAVVIKLEGGASSIAVENINAVFADESLAAAFVDASGWMLHRESHPSATRAEYLTGEARYWLDEPSSAEIRALDAARALTDDELAAALDDPRLIAPNMSPLGTSIEDVAQLRAALDAGAPLARVVAIELFAHARGREAAATAIELSAAPSKYLARLSLRALGLMEGDDVVSALGRGLDHPTEWPSAADALAGSADASVDDALSAWLTGEAVDIDPRTVDAALRVERGARAGRVLRAVAQRQSPAHVELLFRLFDDPTKRPLVPTIVQALAALGTPEVEARGEELQFAMLGMGKALNPDSARRAELLEIDDEDSGGIVSYGGLDVARLTQLLDEGFIHPATRQNEAPSTIEIFEMMQHFPELRASGYAVVPSRADYRVSIDGLVVSLDGVDDDRASELRQLFESFEPTASTLELEEAHLSVWWT